MNVPLSIIIPALNEAATIKETLDAIRAIRENPEIIVVDGGSLDETISIAKSCGVSVLQSKGRGCGAQMRAGAKAAKGDVLWFLHADTRPAPETIEQMTRALEIRLKVSKG